MQLDVITMLLGCLGLLVLALAFGWLVRVYGTPTGPERVVAILLSLLVLESALYANPNDIGVGIFHPQAGPLSFRLFDILIPLAIAAQLVARARARRAGVREEERPFPVELLLWCAFLVWLAVTGLEGVLQGNSSGLVAFHAKAVIYLGTFVLVAAVPPARWLESRALRRTVGGAAVVAAIMMALSEAGVALDLGLPLLPLVGFGVMGSDAATIFAVLGLGTLAVGICSPRSRLPLLACALPLLAAPLVSGQRAAIVGLGASLALGAVLVPFALRNVRLALPELVLAALAALGLAALLVLVDGLLGNVHASIPLADDIKDTFTSRGKQLSEQDRINQWAQARELISARPWFGWGLGKEYDYYSPGFFAFMRTDLTHNIVLDLLLRTGVVGLLLFVVAAAATLRDAGLAWLRDADPRIAALGLGACTALVGLLAKGLAESLFEKYRLAIVIGMLIGVSVSLATARLTTTDAERAGVRLPRAPLGGGALAR